MAKRVLIYHLQVHKAVIASSTYNQDQIGLTETILMVSKVESVRKVYVPPVWDIQRFVTFSSLPLDT